MTTSINLQAAGQTLGAELRSSLQKAADTLSSQFSSALEQAIDSVVKQAAPSEAGSTNAAAATAAETSPGTAPSVANATGPTASTGSPAANTIAWQAPWRKGAETASQYLHDKTADHTTRYSGKPDMATFMQATGASVSTANALLYGVVAGVEEYRDWGAIMASDDPVLAARQATGALYNSDLPYTSDSGFKPTDNQTLASAGNFAWLDVNDRQSLWVMNNRGEAISQVPMSAPDILRTSRDFGLDIGALSTLADQMDARGVRYLPGALHAGSDQGVNLRDLAQGGMGSTYDWTSDPLAHLKGPGAQDAVAANALMAQEMGLKRGASTGQTAPASAPAANGSAPAASNTDNTATSPADVEALGKQLTETLLAQFQSALKGWQANAAGSSSQVT